MRRLQALDQVARGLRLGGLRLAALGEGGRHSSRFTVAIATRASNITALLAVPAILLLFTLPTFASRGLLQELFYVFTVLALAQLWNLLAGSAGLISVGQQAFVGMGAYALFAFTVVAGLDPVPSIMLAGAVAGLVAIPAALIVFRLRGAYFAIGTWVVAEVCRLILAQVKQLGGGTGTSLPPDIAGSMIGIDFVRDLFAVRGPAARDIMAYWLALVLAIGTFVLVYRLLRSRHGLALSAVGDSEAAAESTGVDVFRTKFLIYVMTAAATGMVGALIFLQKARISPDAAFSLIDWTAYVIFIVVIGGIGTMEGPIIGVAIFYLLQYHLAALGSWYLILLGALAILLMLFAPTGVWGMISHSLDLSLFPVRRRLTGENCGLRVATTGLHRRQAWSWVLMTNKLQAAKAPKQALSMIGYRVVPIRRRVWLWEIFARENDRLLETAQAIGSKARAISLAMSAARMWESKNLKPTR